MTKNQQATVKMSLIPLVIIIALIIGAGFLLLKGEIKLPDFNSGPKVKRLQNYPTIVYTDKELTKQRRVITNQQELNDFLNYVDSTGMLVVKDNIDFNKDYLIAVSTGVYNETGHKIKVKRVYMDTKRNKLMAAVEEVELAENCVVDYAKNVAVDIVAVSKTDKKIDFDRTKTVEPCNDTEESTPSEQ